VVFVEFLADLRFRFSLEIFVYALVILVSTPPVGDLAVTRGKVFVLECCGKNGSGLWKNPLASLLTRGVHGRIDLHHQPSRF
jgi:hypothetical protein